MSTRADLPDWVVEALRAKRGRAALLDVCKLVWQQHESDLRMSGDLFYTWQYDIRWAATKLRHAGVMKQASESPAGVWELARTT